MSSVPEEKYLFKLVAFPDDEIDPVSIDIVPDKWIFWDNEADELLCSYMPGELTEKKKKDLQKMVQQCKPADPKWPKHRVMIKGRAQTYKDAEIGIDQLGSKKYAYSTDDEIRCLEKARQEKKNYQRKKVTSNTISVEEQLESARVDLTESVEEQGPEDSAGAIKSLRTVLSTDTSGDTSSEGGSPRQQKLTLISNKPLKEPMGRNGTECSKNSRHNSRRGLSKSRNAEFDKSTPDFDNWEDLYAHGRSRDPVLPRSASRSSDKSNNGIQANEAPSNRKESARKTDSQSSKPKETSRSDKSLSSDKRLEHERLRASAQSRIDSSSPNSISSKKLSKQGRLNLNSMELSNNLQDVGLFTVCEGFDENGSLGELLEQRHREMKKLISDLKGMVVSNGVAIKRLREDLIDNSARGIVGIEEEEEDPDGIQLPCTTLETFDLFEQKLKSDAAYCKKMKRIISKSTDRDQEMTRCLGACIRMFMTQSVGMLFVPLKATRDKRVFMDTALCKIVQDIFVRVFGTQENPVSTQKFQKSLKGILNNTKDWPDEAKRVRVRDKKNDNTPLVENLRNEEQDSDV